MKYSNVYLFFCFLYKHISNAIYDPSQLDIGVFLSGASYCGKEKYSSMKLKGPAMNFIYESTIYDENTDLQGYIGVLHKTIYVVLRGSNSLENWLYDLRIYQIPYEYPNCEECFVHEGFYEAALGIKNQTISSLTLLQNKYHSLSYDIIVTGHSLGAAVGQLLSMELIKEGFSIKHYNYGQPRIGNSNYAKHVNIVIKDMYRITHNRDIVPHIPPSEMNYMHSCGEIFENVNHILVFCCFEECEGKNGINQYVLLETNQEDHFFYLQHFLDCNSSILLP